MQKSNGFNPADMSGASFKQCVALLASMRAGKIGFDPNRGPKDHPGGWHKDAFIGYILANSTEQMRVAAWEKFTGQKAESTSTQAATTWKAEAASFSDFDVPAESGATMTAVGTEQAPTAKAVNPHPPGSLESRVWDIARDAAQGAAGAVDVAQVQAIVRKALAEATQPTRVIVTGADAADVKFEGIVHSQFPELLKVLQARQPDGYALNPWLVGPPGTGKSHAAKQIAQALGLPFGYTGPIGTKYDLLGFNTATGEFSGTEFYNIWTKGGVFLFDEIRGSVPSALLAFMGALANGRAPFANGTAERHPDCIIIVADNTRPGATSAEFNGGFKQDGALGSRFVTVDWPIDPALESAMAFGEQGPAWLATVRKFRRAAESQGAKLANVTPRAVTAGCALIGQGFQFPKVAEMVIRGGLNDEAWNSLKSAAL